MLYNTFKHLKRIGCKKEYQLWDSGIISWDKFEQNLKRQLNLFEDQLDESKMLFSDSNKALEKKDTNFFATRLSKEDYYRIALHFGEENLFLDIETTGLSKYYDEITVVGWSVKNDYQIYIQGTDSSKLISAISKAKVITTFNGTLFDLPFLKEKFNNLDLTLAHIDLRFLAKRVGLSGGQKKIEKELGIERPSYLQTVKGENAPLLWHKYCRGDLESLKLLIHYNHADIEGMKKIFAVVVKKIIEKQNIPLKIRSLYPTPNYPSNLEIFIPQSNQNTNNANSLVVNNSKILLPKIEANPTLSMENLTSGQNLSNIPIVGIDLSGQEKKASGWCLLKGNLAITQAIKTDVEIIEATLNTKPNLVAIDSPLSLPKGRITVDDSDPGRTIYGITRDCERILKKRGINVYPTLIPSMQKLTARGIRLANHFRSLGIPVIESYPGSAQDILRIPRKQIGLEYLRDGLMDFGIEGEFCHNSVSHDELDAITSALVGLFFWAGKFEGLGNEEEDYLIIPNPNLKSSIWEHKIVIGFSGGIASGKTTASKFLESHGFKYARFSMVLENLLRQRNIEPSREALQQVGIEVNQKYGQRWLCKQLIEEVSSARKIVVDGLRFPEDHGFLVERFGTSFVHIHLDLPQDIRKKRYIARGGTNQEFLEASSRSTEAKIETTGALAHKIISNVNDLESLLTEISHKGIKYIKQVI